jgi:hypothetical protein
VNDSYLGATEGELLGAPLARRLAAYSDQRRLFPHRHQPGPPTGAAASHVVLRGGARIMMPRLIAALLLAALIIVSVSGCHVHVAAAGPAPQASPAGR